MRKKYSVYSLIFIALGIFISIMGFPPIRIEFLGMWEIFIGFTIYLVGLILGGKAFLKKEKGFLKYISLLSVVFGIIYVVFLFGIIGQI
ncbi:hypothetical protein [Psychrobacillus vulpis]|uniref:DUF3953 domain-containing protein n=1 Tax=Psychrobacillus vulpis TaxID=2325572 RepID=A0A544TBR1_9BACI|nr:hypothetical protein [Psychrobacillus vulpis]TQR14848.1 hypothetical protein FG384_19430 [Psychrobacillus vulpis]